MRTRSAVDETPMTFRRLPIERSSFTSVPLAQLLQEESDR
jgi:hypothetical protein